MPAKKAKVKAKVKPKVSPKKSVSAKPAKKATAKAAPAKPAPKTSAKKAASKPKPKAAPVKPASKAASPKAVSVKTPALITKAVSAGDKGERKNNVKETLRRMLVRKREEIVKEAKAEIKKYISGENRQLVETVMDEGDLSVVDLSEDISLKKLSTHREVMIKIDTALRKLDEGSYGLCEDCGDEISEERLKIMPFAIYCRDCQEKKELMEKIEKEGLM